MAEVIVQDPLVASQAGAMAQTVTQGQSYDANGDAQDGAGKYGRGEFSTAANGSKGLSADLTNEIQPDLLHTSVDRQVVEAGFTTAPIDRLMRDTGSETIKSLRFKYYMIESRKTETKLAAAVTAISNVEAAPKNPAKASIWVLDPDVIDATDVIIFEEAPGYFVDKETGEATKSKYLHLAARVCNKTKNKGYFTSSGTSSSSSTGIPAYEIEIQYLNAIPTNSGANLPKAGSKVVVLGHAAAEEDASTTPWNALPEPTEQFMQKFMVQSLVSNVWQESTKDINWTKTDVDRNILKQLEEDIERFYIFGVKSWTYDADTRVHTRTCAGIIAQMLEGGSTVIDWTNTTADFTTLLEAVRAIFVGNSGNSKRYMFAGSHVAPAIWGIVGQNTSGVNNIFALKDYKVLDFDVTGLNLLGFQLPIIHHPLFDKMGFGNYALVIDRQYLKKAVFSSLRDSRLEMKKTGAYDGDSTVWAEISAPILKYPKAHALWIFPKQTVTTTPATSEVTPTPTW